MLHTIKQLGNRVLLQTKSTSSPYSIAGYREFKVLSVNQKQIQQQKPTTFHIISPNHCQQRFVGDSNTLTSSNMKRLQGKVAVVTASTDG